MARKDLLSEAIADAKAVKETAMANAKLALEEAFTPKLQSMISAKLAEEADDEEVDETYEGEETEESYHEEEDMEVSEEEEEIDLDEVIKTLKEMEDGSEEEVTEEEEDMEAELEEAYKTIKSLQSTINEVNLLNAKLLYTNKLFRTFDLNEGQKVKVLENFDRTSSVREVKLVFSTIAENLNVARKKRTVVKEGYASKATKSSAPKKIISEGNEMAARWKKLAGLK